MARAKGSPARTAALFLLAGLIGALGGLLGFLFQQLLQELQLFRLAHGGTVVDAAAKLPAWQRVLVPAGGGLLAALCLLAVRNKRGPFGITDVMELVITRVGGIRLRESLAQILSSAFSIATGSSIGRESANSQLGATAASTLGDLFKVSSRDRAVLLGCGVAAGMAISYHAPIAGALFVMEVVLGNFAMDVFAPIVVSAVVATLVNAALQGEGASTALYTGAQIGNVHGDVALAMWALACAAVLGVVCGFGAIGFRRTLDAGQAAFRRLALPPWTALPLGGLLVGVIGVWRPEVWGNGQSVVKGITGASAQYSALYMLVTILVLKSIATSISIGSGSLGGVFTPNLVVGAALGACAARGIAAAVPAGSLPLAPAELQTALALVGMAGLVAATTHAPITAVLLVFELTQDYGLILPVMVCSILGSLVARLIDRESIFTARLAARGHILAGGVEALAMQTNYVRDVMRTDVYSLVDTATFDAVMEVFSTARCDTIYVVDAEQRLLGRIHIHDVKAYINDPTLASVVIAGDLTQAAPAVRPEQSLAEIFHLFDDPDLDALPVVASKTDDRLLGRLTRRDVIALLSAEVLGRRSLRAKLRVEDAIEDTYVQLPAGSELARLAVPPSLHGISVESAALPRVAGLVPLVVIRTAPDGREVRALPTPDTVIEPGMSLVVLGTRQAIAGFAAAVDGRAGSSVADAGAQGQRP